MASGAGRVFGDIGRFSGVNESGEERYDWVENAKAYLASGKLEEYQYGAAI